MSNGSLDKSMIPLEKYKELMAMSPICTVDVLFFTPDLKKTLLFLRTDAPAKGSYFSMGGRLLKNETFLECAKRQVQKETGLAIDESKLVQGPVMEEIWPDSKFEGISYHAVNIYYGYILGGEEKITMDDQHSDHAWLSVGDPTLHPGVKAKIDRLVQILAGANKIVQ